MKSVKRFALTLCVALGTLLSAKAVGWPANYEGVMLQGFYWDSHQSETKWTLLEEKADEYSKYFSLIWVPNSAKSTGGLGYLPVYWFTNHNSSMGGEQQLRSMINTYKSKGVGIIADVVINHRCGVSNWTNFPTETWNGTTYKIGLDGICSNDEVANEPGQGKPTGAPDTGENYAAARDLDHTNANVQNNCKAYTKCLLEDFGYAGFRYDYCKGYKGEYNKMYNQYSKPRFSVGEYWDGSYDAVAAWIESTGKESAAFDFPFKYAVNKAFSTNDMTQLVWKANGTTDQPAGMIHFGYSQYAVTFIDNHDTSRDGNKFNGNVVAANAFMLCSPGTPCVFLPHYNANKAAIQALIDVRNACGLHNNSKVTVLRSTKDCYMAEVQGSKGTLVVKIGSAQVSPDGYTNSDIKASGTDYCVWSKAGVNPNPNPDPKPGTTVTVYWDNSTAKWATPTIHYWGGEESTWPGVAMTKVEGDIWKYTCPAGTTGCLFNAGDGDATKTSDFTAIDGHIYNQSGDQGEYKGGGDDPKPGTTVTVYWDNVTAQWATPTIHYWGGEESTWPGVAMTKVEGDIWKYTCPAGTTGCLFNAGDGDATKTSDFTAIDGHIYNQSGDQGEYKGGGDDPKPGNYPATLYLIGNVNGTDWATTADAAIPAKGSNGVYTYSNVTVDDAGAGAGYFAFITVTGSDWDAEVNQGDRYGAPAKDTPVTVNDPTTITLYAAGVNASASESWMINAGVYDITADLSTMKLTVTTAGGVETVLDNDASMPVEYYNLQGIKVATPTSGNVYIRRQGSAVTKIRF